MSRCPKCGAKTKRTKTDPRRRCGAGCGYMRGPENLGTDGRPLDPSRTLPFSLAAWSASLVATTASAEPTYSRVNEKTREESLVVALVVLTILFVVMMSLIARGPR